MIVVMNGKSNKLLEELEWCERIIRSVRSHYVELEKSDFENLKE